MHGVVPTAPILQIPLLLCAATTDVATRVISDEICLALALVGMAGQLAIPTENANL